MKRNKFCSDCEYYTPIDIFIGKCKIKNNKYSWVDRPACDDFKYEESDKSI